jgi:hypothetical protein
VSEESVITVIYRSVLSENMLAGSSLELMEEDFHSFDVAMGFFQEMEVKGCSRVAQTHNSA